MNLPSGKNFTDYSDRHGHFNILKFFEEHSARFPSLHILVNRHCSIFCKEAGAERVFLQSNIIAQPTRSNIGVATYERLVRFKVNWKNVRVPTQTLCENFSDFKQKNKWSKLNNIHDAANDA